MGKLAADVMEEIKISCDYVYGLICFFSHIKSSDWSLFEIISVLL